MTDEPFSRTNSFHRWILNSRRWRFAADEAVTPPPKPADAAPKAEASGPLKAGDPNFLPIAERSLLYWLLHPDQIAIREQASWLAFQRWNKLSREEQEREIREQMDDLARWEEGRRLDTIRNRQRELMREVAEREAAERQAAERVTQQSPSETLARAREERVLARMREKARRGDFERPANVRDPGRDRGGYGR